MKKEVWVLGDLRNERFFKASLKVLGKACQLARQVDGQAAMILMGTRSEAAVADGMEPAESCISMASAAERAVKNGADRIFECDHPLLQAARPDLFAGILETAVVREKPLLVLFALSDFARELAARAAAKLNAGLIADCIDIGVQNDRIVASCPSWGGEIMAQISYADSQTTGFATVQPHRLPLAAQKGVPGEISRWPVDGLTSPKRLQLVSRTLEAESHRRLEEAAVVVVGGAGLGSMEGFAKVRELAASLGGEVGATRPPVLQHWVDEDRLIGQTGKNVRPQLLFSIGTSGAVQYTAGILESETIVAVNRDKNAPIFQVADLGLVSDVRTILPVLTDKIKQVVMRKMADMLCAEKDRPSAESFGDKVCKLRESHQFTVEELAQATGQTPEFIEKIEKEEFSPSVSFLLRLARVLGVDPSTFLSKAEKDQIRGERAQSFIKRTRNYSYQTLTPGAENSHLRGFMVTIPSKQDHKPVAYKHEGEEFIYVMEGDLELTLGGKSHILKPGETIHFNSEIPHKLRSLSNQDTRCLVVLYTL